MSEYIDIGSLGVIIITFLLFSVALFAKGFTHDLLLEAGVLLVSIKLIINAYRSNFYVEELKKELGEIKELLLQNSR